jgi:hypothetical protein
MSMSEYRARQHEDDIYPGYDEDGEDIDNYDIDPDLQRDLQLEREYAYDHLVSADDESRYREASEARGWAEARLQDVILRYASPRRFIESLGPLDTEWKRDLAERARDTIRCCAEHEGTLP